jgi:hypothetical protein
MTSRKLLLSLLVILMVSLYVGAHPAAADSSHARIIRLSLVQGDVRFARETHGDPLADSKATWEAAGLNLPIRQGYVLATDNGRAEVEFENGAVAFLKEHTVLEFYDLSLNDSERTTRLVLRQGSAAFYVNPGGGDYFSVTGGDFTVEALGRSEFRLDTFDDGSTVEAYRGRVSVLHNKNETRLQKGQSLSVKAGDDSSLNVGDLAQEDDFDRWVSGQIDSVIAATTASQQYTGSSNYVPGFADLYTYGAFSNCGAYGYGWRPFGAGLGWSPFTSGQWIFDPASGGYAWLSYQPWGWAPYHYGGWLFDASCGGWFYSPPLLYGYAGYPGGPVRRFPRGVHPPHPIYHPVTAVFVRNGGKTGIVPMHPLDGKGKTPLNLERGVFSVAGTKGVGSQLIPVERGQKWETLKSPREVISNAPVAAGPPARVSRTVEAGKSGVRAVSLGKDSSIAYDPHEHRFVNTNSPAVSSTVNEKGLPAQAGRTGGGAASTPLAGTPPRPPAAPPASRSASFAPPRNSVQPPAPRYSGGSSSAGGRGGGWSAGSSSSSGTSSGRSSSSSASSSAPASHPSTGRPH